ncbi:hypothetical protein [Rhizohabitans arisaemae]|uniref:hypothetical protein n=1 Tax=Rhizohabitans arisaemae TaxID=2720610 RepID=UPI0024B1E360|nr:hypothetical protein [Rhizohabitans arisaemae]
MLSRFAPALTGLFLGALVLGPALGPGFVLRYDMVFVPDPPLWTAGSGLPRAVPSDFVVALLSLVVPPQVVQKLVLLAIFVLAAAGAAALVPSRRTVPRLAAAVCYVWSAYLAQRLLLGHWALLLGYAGLPFVVLAAHRLGEARAGAFPGRVARLALALVPAAVGGFQAMLVSALVLVAVTRTRRGLLAAVAVSGALSLPWLIPALAADAAADPAGVDAFAARADGPFGTAGSLLTLGGAWNAEAAVPGQGLLWSASVRLVVAVVGIWGFLRAARGPAKVWGPRLAVAAAVGYGIALAGATPFGAAVLKGLGVFWTGFGPLRDGQVYVAPLALVVAVGFAVVVGGLARRDAAGRIAGAVGILAPILALPTLAWGASGSLRAVDYPADWRRVQAIVAADPAPGRVLVLPWNAYRAFGWNGGRVVLDPAVKLFGREVVWNDTLVVEAAGGEIAVAAENPRVRRLTEAVTGSDAPLEAVFRAEGVRYVLVEVEAADRAKADNCTLNGSRYRCRFPEADIVYTGPDLLLLRLDRSE